MDDNKVEVLKEIGFRINKCCGLCKYFAANRGNVFGDCIKYTYKHLKHTAESKSLSVSIFGGCDDWKPSDGRINNLHGFAQFVK